jgi:hypothetical protein
MLFFKNNSLSSLSGWIGRGEAFEKPIIQPKKTPMKKDLKNFEGVNYLKNLIVYLDKISTIFKKLGFTSVWCLVAFSKGV